MRLQTSRRRQRGITFMGWVFLLLPVALVVYAGIRITPAYLNYFKVARALEQVQTEYAAAGGTTREAIRNSLEKRLDIEGVRTPRVRDIGITRADGVWIVDAEYESIQPLFYNVSLLLSFNKEVTIP